MATDVGGYVVLLLLLLLVLLLSALQCCFMYRAEPGFSREGTLEEFGTETNGAQCRVGSS